MENVPGPGSMLTFRVLLRGLSGILWCHGDYSALWHMDQWQCGQRALQILLDTAAEDTKLGEAAKITDNRNPEAVLGLHEFLTYPPTPIRALSKISNSLFYEAVPSCWRAVILRMFLYLEFPFIVLSVPSGVRQERLFHLLQSFTHVHARKEFLKSSLFQNIPWIGSWMNSFQYLHHVFLFFWIHISLSS